MEEGSPEMKKYTGIGLGIGKLYQKLKPTDSTENTSSFSKGGGSTNLENLKNSRLGITPTPKTLPNPTFANFKPTNTIKEGLSQDLAI